MHKTATQTAGEWLPAQREMCARIAYTLANAPVDDPSGYSALAHLKLPGPDYCAVLRLVHTTLRPNLYVEIGVSYGTSLVIAQPDTRCIAIDPSPNLDLLRNPPTNIALNVMTSDNFFANVENREKVRGFDLAFIDGDQSFEQALRDFENLEALANSRSLIAIHDVIPMDQRTSTPTRQSTFWSGNVWRLMARIAQGRPDLVAFTVACPPTGLGIVGRFNAARRGVPTPSLEIPFDADWERQRQMLNIVENNLALVGQALQDASQ